MKDRLVRAWRIARWAVYGLAVGLGAAVVAYLLRPKPGGATEPELEAARQKARDKMAALQARAAAEIAVARSGETEARAQLDDILEDPSEQSRLRRLTEMGRRLKGTP